MSNKALIEVQGFDELLAKLKTITNDKTKKRDITSVLRAVAGVTVKAARNEAPMSKKPHLISGKRTRKIINPGALKKSIGVIVGKKGNAKENPTVYAGPRAKGNFDGFYGAWVEQGHKVKSKSGGKSKSKANNYMKRAYSQTNGQVTPEAEKRVAKVIQRIIDKNSK